MEIHREMGTILGGVHLELTGEVNEEGFSVVSFWKTSNVEMR
jgi:3-deoxy-7-phosphoheptulonate synthase